MKLVLLSGGSGKRLWPLSNDARSKQFLKVLENDSNELVSMVQRVWGQIAANGLAESCYIATNKSQIEIMRSQIGEDIPLIVEPERRDTFAAIMLAATFLYSHDGNRWQIRCRQKHTHRYVDGTDSTGEWTGND